MPNLLLTSRCRNNCAYCFRGAQTFEELTPEKVTAILPLLRSFKRNTVNLLGGEPTLNPDFIIILQLLLAEGWRVKIFTNGKIPGKLINELQQIMGDFSFCVNRTDPSLSPETIDFYHKLGYKIQLGVTIHQKVQPLDHIFREISAYRLERYFRLGIALPVWPHRPNSYLPPGDYAETGLRILPQLLSAAGEGIKPEFDCGFPLCFFPGESRTIFADRGIEFKSLCGIIPDISPRRIMPCFPLSAFSLPLSPESTWAGLQDSFNAVFAFQTPNHLFPACSACNELTQGNCCGGCAAFRPAVYF